MAANDFAASAILTPILRGESRSLSVADQAVIATWAFQTGYVIDSAAIGGDGPRFPLAHRQRMLQYHAPPELSAVWITSWPGTMTAWTHHWGLQALRAGESPSGEVNAYGVTIALGPIVLRTYAATDDDLDPRHLREHRRGVMRILPVTNFLTWEPRFWLSAEQLEELAYSIPRALERGIAPTAVPFYDPNWPNPEPVRPG